MKEAKPDWEAIKTEYIQTRITAKNLAMKYGVNFSTLRNRIRRGGWTEQRNKYRQTYGELASVKPENLNVSVPGCMMGYCKKRRSRNECQHCGFYADEAERRKQIPLTVGKNGLRRKVLRMEE